MLEQKNLLGEGLINVRQGAALHRASADEKETHRLKTGQFRVVQHKSDVVQRDHFPLVQADENVSFLKACARGDAFRPDLQDQHSSMQLRIGLADQVGAHALGL